jgi:hypothetical protein
MRVRVEGVCDQADTDRARGLGLKVVDSAEDGEGESLLEERVALLVGVAVLVGDASVGGGN